MEPYNHSLHHGKRVEIENFGEGTITEIVNEEEVEISMSELETYRVPIGLVREINPTK